MTCSCDPWGCPLNCACSCHDQQRAVENLERIARRNSGLTGSRA